MNRLTEFLARRYAFCKKPKLKLTFVLTTAIFLLSCYPYSLSYLNINNITLSIAYSLAYALGTFGLLSLYQTKDFKNTKKRATVLIVSFTVFLLSWMLQEYLAMLSTQPKNSLWR